MKIDQIYSMWEHDSKIDITDLSSQASNIPQLHAKYYKIFVGERILLKKYQVEYKKLKFDKHEFFLNPTEEDIVVKQWKVPERGRLLKNEVAQYLEGDSNLLEKEMQIGIQEEKVEMLRSIIDQINKRGFLIKNIIDDRKFVNGG